MSDEERATSDLKDCECFFHASLQTSIILYNLYITWLPLALGWSHKRTITQTDRNRYKKSLPSTRNRHQKRVRSHETTRKRWRRCSTYAGPVSGAVLLPQKQRRRLPAHSYHGYPSVYSPLWLSFSLPEASVCSRCFNSMQSLPVEASTVILSG